MRNRILEVFAALFLLFSTATSKAQTADDLILMSEQFPPYNFEKDGRLQGISIDLMTLCLDKLGSRQTRRDIRILPWARSYKQLLEEENTVLFAMTRTEQRENLFKWAGPISSSRNVLLAKKAADIKIISPDDLKKYKVGTIRDDAGEQLVVEHFGFTEENLELTSSARSSVLQLAAGRIDIFAYDENVARWIMNQEGIDSSQYESVYVLSEGFHYFGFNIRTADSLVRQFQQAIDELKAEGIYDIILARYQ